MFYIFTLHLSFITLIGSYINDSLHRIYNTSREDVFAKVIDEVNSLSPDAVIITGDLTNEGLKEEYEQCKELVSKINVEKIIAISGNHDYRNTGYLHFKKYFPFQTINELGNDVVVVTVGTARPDRDECDPCDNENIFVLGNVNGDLWYYDDVSLEPSVSVDLFDVLRLVEIVESNDTESCGYQAADFTGEGDVNTFDIYALVGLIMDGTV